jgi:hypothetical protein
MGDNRDDAPVVIAQGARDLARREDEAARCVEDDLDRPPGRRLSDRPQDALRVVDVDWRINGMPSKEMVSCRWISVITVASCLDAISASMRRRPSASRCCWTSGWRELRMRKIQNASQGCIGGTS